MAGTLQRWAAGAEAPDVTAVDVRPASRALVPAPRTPLRDRLRLADHPRRLVGRAVIDCLDEGQAVDAICRMATDSDMRGHIVVTPNIQHVALLERDPAFEAAYADASLTLADGWPVARAARTSRVCGSDLFGLVCAEAARRGLTVGIVGGRPGAAGRAVERLTTEHPDLVVAVVDVPSYGFEHSPDQIDRLVERVGQARPDVLFLALGAPKQ